ncbi:MAG: hypothetical protein OEQ39_04230 [Gammaproteobacteria bacterium]|nr:hypothetical protein [Gammaproteobacteria bacterium]
MAKIVDPDQLNQATEVTFNTAGKTIDLAVAGNLDDNSPGRSSGVTHQALYSFTKEEWLATSGLQSSRFPFDPIFEAKFDWINDWQPNDAQSRDLIRDGGFRVVLLNDEYACLISLQDFAAVGDQAYYWNDSTARFTGVPTNFDKTGELNEPFLIFDGTNDYRDFLKVFLRIQGKTHGYGDLLVDQGLSSISYQAYRVPLSNVDDPNVIESDANIDAQTPYTNIALDFLNTPVTALTFTTAAATTYAAGDVVQDGTGRWAYCTTGGTVTTPGGAFASFGGTSVWEAYAGEEQIGTNYYAFNRIISLSSGTATAQEIYEWGERQLRKAGTINANTLGSPNQNGFGTVDGELAMDLFDYIGSTLRTRPGVLIRNFDANDTNSLELRDITVDGGGLDQDFVPVTSTIRTFPFVAAGTITFSQNLVDQPDVDTLYKMYFQYTKLDTNTDYTITAASGNTATFNSPTLDLTTFFTNSDYCELDGFLTNTVNNGVFQVSAVVAGSMTITKVNGETLVNDALADSVTVYTDPYDSPDAVVVNDNSATPITGQITAGSIAFDFDYDNNVQGGRTAATNAPVAIIAMAKDGAQWIDGLFTITRTTGLSFPLNAATERVYLNP